MWRTAGTPRRPRTHQSTRALFKHVGLEPNLCAAISVSQTTRPTGGSGLAWCAGRNLRAMASSRRKETIRSATPTRTKSAQASTRSARSWTGRRTALPIRRSILIDQAVPPERGDELAEIGGSATLADVVLVDQNIERLLKGFTDD